MTNKNFFASVAAVLLTVALFAVPPASAQTILTQTTLAAAVTSTSQTFVTVSSATGITANSTVLFVADGLGELLFVNSVNGTTIGVTRGSNGSQAASTHASGALVFVAPPYAIATQAPTGSCTRSNQLYLPVIALGVGGAESSIADCVGGQWVVADAKNSNATFSVVYHPQPGAVLYTGINTNGTTLAATTMYCTELDVQQSKNVTGLAALLGTTGGTDKHISVLYDATGNLLANSATAGTTAGTASTYEHLDFTKKYYLVGPAKYYGCLQTNGTTATVRMLITSVQDGYTTKGVTGQTFGTIPATITVPTTFTTAVGPYWQLY